MNAYLERLPGGAFCATRAMIRRAAISTMALSCAEVPFRLPSPRGIPATKGEYLYEEIAWL
jgi:hypothetical protein